MIAAETDSKRKNSILYSRSTKKIISKNLNIITIHSHPHSYPPSIEDFNSNFIHDYNLGIICCHNGKIFVYNSHDYISNHIYEVAVVKYKKRGYNEYESQLNALYQLQKEYDISFMEVLL